MVKSIHWIRNRLQTWVLVLCLCIPLSSAFSGDALIKPDPLRFDRYQITDTKGNHTGTLIRDPMDIRRILITNPKGEPTGYIKPRILPTSNKRYDTFTPSGDYAGSIRQDILRKDRYRYQGKTIKRDVLRQDRWLVD